MTDQTDIVDEARKWLGVKWQHQGRTKYGVDCVGLIVVVAKELGLMDYDFAGYGRRPDNTFLSHFENNGTRVPRIEKEVGDIGIFKDSLYPCHVGFIASQGARFSIIHSRAPNKVMEETFDHELKENLVAVYRFKGLADG